MAAKTGLINTLQLLRGKIDTAQIKLGRTSSYEIPTHTVTRNERDRVIRTVSEELRGTATSQPADIFSYIRTAVQNAAFSRQDNLRIMEMVPELKAATKIIIPSIMAPNDLRTASMSFRCESKRLSDAQRKEVVTIITEHFLKEYELEQKLPDMIKEAYYIAGSKPLVVIPVSELRRRFADKDAIMNTQNGNFTLDRKHPNI